MQAAVDHRPLTGYLGTRRRQKAATGSLVIDRFEVRNQPMQYEYAFEMATSSVRFGVGATREIGMDLADLGVRRAMVVTDANLARLPPVATVLESLRREGVAFLLFD